jgi:hypothetical protein
MLLHLSSENSKFTLWNLRVDSESFSFVLIFDNVEKNFTQLLIYLKGFTPKIILKYSLNRLFVKRKNIYLKEKE